MLLTFPYCGIWQKNCNFHSSLWSWPYSSLSSIVWQWLGMLQILIFSSASQVLLVWSVERLSTCHCSCKARQNVAVLLGLGLQGLKIRALKSLLCEAKSREKALAYFYLTSLLKEGAVQGRNEILGLLCLRADRFYSSWNFPHSPWNYRLQLAPLGF